MPAIVSRHSLRAAMRSPCASASRAWSLNVAAMSSPKSPRNSTGNSRSSARKKRCDRDIDSPYARGSGPFRRASPRSAESLALRPAEQRLAPCDRERVLEARRLGARDVAAECGEGIRAPPVIAALRAMSVRLANQSVGEQPLDDPVERAGAETDAAARELLDFFHDRVAVRFAVGKRDEHVEHRRGQRQQIVGVAPDHMAYDDMSRHDTLSSVVQEVDIAGMVFRSRQSVVALAAALAAACNRAQSTAAPPAFPPVVVTIAPARPAPIEDATEYVATLKSLHSTAIQPQIDGQITQILVKSGDRVAAGAPLIQIDPRRQQAAVSSQQAERAAR